VPFRLHSGCRKQERAMEDKGGFIGETVPFFCLHPCSTAVISVPRLRSSRFRRQPGKDGRQPGRRSSDRTRRPRGASALARRDTASSHGSRLAPRATSPAGADRANTWKRGPAGPRGRTHLGSGACHPRAGADRARARESRSPGPDDSRETVATSRLLKSGESERELQDEGQHDPFPGVPGRLEHPAGRALSGKGAGA